MSTDVRPLVEQIARTRGELADALGDPELPTDRARYAAVSKRWADLSEAFELAALWEDAADRAGEAEALLAEDDDDDEVRSLLEEARAELADLAPRIREAMIEPDPDDDRNTIVEIRAGTGGEEAALFARDLVEIYSRYAESRGLAVELMAASEADAGGLREATAGREGPRRLRRLQARGRRAPRAADPRHREPGAHPHLHRDGGGAARGRGRRRHDRPERRQARRLPLQRPRRPEREHDRLGRPR